MRPAGMTDAEIESCREHFAAARSMIEFGCGGSTMMAVEIGVPKILSVESDKEWIKRLRQEAIILAGERRGQLVFHHANVGPVASMGFPKDERFRKRWPRYPRAPWRGGPFGLIRRRYAADLVFIDGRFRVACAIETAANAEPGTKVLVHDYRDRPHYWAIATFLAALGAVDTLASFVVRERLPEERRRQLLAQHWRDPR